jgi:hypothetical protein
MAERRLEPAIRIESRLIKAERLYQARGDEIVETLAGHLLEDPPDDDRV